MEGFHGKGMKHVVLCPGNRSSPLAIAAGWLAEKGYINLTTAIDERSASFMALGLSTANGLATCVITTSGTAVAELLPAAVEADRSCQPLLLITADRPERLKNCGANQTVNQEEFLLPVARSFCEGPKDGIHLVSPYLLASLINDSWNSAHDFPGPVHLNLPLEEPLLANSTEQEQVFSGWSPSNFSDLQTSIKNVEKFSQASSDEFVGLDPGLPGLILAGPWRGQPKNLYGFQKTIFDWQKISGWPIFADPLSAIAIDQPGLIQHWELFLPLEFSFPFENLQILRLGPISVSRNLELWLKNISNNQILVTEGDPRNLDPIGISEQWSYGFENWFRIFKSRNSSAYSSLTNESFNSIKKSIMKDLLDRDLIAQSWLDRKLKLEGAVNEPALAHWMPRLIPKKIPLMLSSSSPVRDWLSFPKPSKENRRIFAFRGASGIDGTLSLGCGLSMELGPLVLITGDLALLHDSNGWMFANSYRLKLVVLLIDNGGGGIFHQLHCENLHAEKIDQLFSMPQSVDHLALADAYHIPRRQVSCMEDLPNALEWGFAQYGPVLLRVCTNPLRDSILRDELRKGLAKKLKDETNEGSPNS